MGNTFEAILFERETKRGPKLAFKFRDRDLYVDMAHYQRSLRIANIEFDDAVQPKAGQTWEIRQLSLSQFHLVKKISD